MVIKMGIIYKATNLINKKVYIGQTVKTLKERIYKHLCEGKCPHFYRALKKYGKDNFEWEIIKECEEQKLGKLNLIIFEEEKKKGVPSEELNQKMADDEEREKLKAEYRPVLDKGIVLPSLQVES